MQIPSHFEVVLGSATFENILLVPRATRIMIMDLMKRAFFLLTTTIYKQTESSNCMKQNMTDLYKIVDE